MISFRKTQSTMTLLMFAMTACTSQELVWRDFTNSGRGIAELRMDAALCQQVSQNVPQLQSPSCVGSTSCALTGIGTGLQNSQNAQNAFNNCMTSRGWEPGTGSEATVAQDPFTEGNEAFYRKDYSAALKWWQQAGNMHAENNIGYLYQNGLGVNKDCHEAMQWYLTAANQGEPSAENNLGWLYHKGWGVKKDDVQARQWFELSAQQGNEKAKANLLLLKQASHKKKRKHNDDDDNQ
jgi:TPR repeat protein